MDDEYTPPTDQVRRYWQYGVNAWRDGVARDDDTQADGSSAGAEFDRWLAVRDAEKWDEGLQAGQDRWMDSREFGDPPVNPYRVQENRS